MTGKKFLIPIILVFVAGCSAQQEPKQQLIHHKKTVADDKSTKNNETTSLTSQRINTELKTQDTLSERQQVKAPPNLGIARSPMPTTLATTQIISPAKAPRWNRESYNAVKKNGFISTANDSLSTFSIDVDTASYSNVRRFINEGQKPPRGAVRIEEMINYFSYSYPQPSGDLPFSVTTELGPCFWNIKHQLVRIGLKARDIDKSKLPPSNFVFLVDVSGSMASFNKLPLLQQSMKMLVRQLGKNDRVSIVAYAGSDYVALLPTSGSEHNKIFSAIDMLGAGGSTHASSGIATAYQLAGQVFIPGGNNRIILASDGDFNVGITSRGELQKLIEEKRKTGIYLTVLGFGMGNYHDDSMELLADKGNGNYAYIDNLLEARKVLVKEMSGNLFTLARDVKIQVEFNPEIIGAYRLIGYENRALADEDFNDDAKDAGEIGVGHTVTALYELIPARSEGLPSVDPLKYHQPIPLHSRFSDELMTVKLRYKPLHNEQSKLISTVVSAPSSTRTNTSIDFRFATAVAAYSMKLAGYEEGRTLDYEEIMALAKKAKGSDNQGYRSEFIRLVEMTQFLP